MATKLAPVIFPVVKFHAYLFVGLLCLGLLEFQQFLRDPGALALQKMLSGIFDILQMTFYGLYCTVSICVHTPCDWSSEVAPSHFESAGHWRLSVGSERLNPSLTQYAACNGLVLLSDLLTLRRD